MPIKPENRKRYPANWKQIRATILERAGHRCEGSPAFPHCRAPNGEFRVKGMNSEEYMPREMLDGFDATELTRIVLTIGHLDHTPENCDPSNLRAWCQRCHLTYDAKHHAQNANETRRAGKAAGDLFDAAMAQGLGVVA
jgi:hypothetical protein